MDLFATNLSTTTVSLPVHVSITASETRPSVKARNGRWVEPTHVHLTFTARVTLPGNVVVEPLNLNNTLKFTRRVDEPTAWRVDCARAWGFEAYLLTFGVDALEAARNALAEYRVLDLFRIARDAHKRGE